MLLIVNADDLGLGAGVDRAIAECAAAGSVTSASLLVCAPHAHEAAEAARAAAVLDIGLHVDLTLGGPALDPARVPSLVNAEGRFLPRDGLVRRLVSGRVDRRQVAAEVAAQLARMRALGLEPTHWDAHQDAAHLPGLIRAAASALADVPAARTSRVWQPARTGSRIRRVLRDGVRAGTARGLRRRFATPDYQTSAELCAGATQTERWRALAQALPATTIEVVCHPGYPDAQLEALTPTFVAIRAADVQALLAPDAAELLTMRGHRLAGYATLAAGRPTRRQR